MSDIRGPDTAPKPPHARNLAGGAVAAGAVATGLLCGLALVGAIAWIRRALPQTLPGVLHPPSLGGALLASATASFGEEILCRLFLLSALLRILPASRDLAAAADAEFFEIPGRNHFNAAFCVGTIAGGVIGVAMIVLRGNYRGNMQHVREIIGDAFTSSSVADMHDRANKRRPRWHRLPYGVPLCIGFVGYLFYWYATM